MSEATVTPRARPAPGARPPPHRRSMLRPVLLAVAVIVLLALPLYVEEFWLRTGFAVFAAMVGAIGLNLLVGNTGQLSLAHAFFLAVGAVTYVFVSGESGGIGLADLSGLGLPPLLGMIAGVLAAGLAGLLFSPIAARLRGIYLGVASLALVFIGQHVLNSWTSVTGGFNGRSAPEFALFGFTFGNRDPELFVIGCAVPRSRAALVPRAGAGPGGVPVRAEPAAQPPRSGAADPARQRGRRIRDGRQRPALQGAGVPREFHVRGARRRDVRVDHRQHRAGVLRARVVGPVPRHDRPGRARVGGRISARRGVRQRPATGVPAVRRRRALRRQCRGGGLAPGEAARYFFGLAIILVVMFEPAGLAGLAGRFRRKGRDPGGGRRSKPPATSDSSTTSVPSDRPAQGSTS